MNPTSSEASSMFANRLVVQTSAAASVGSFDVPSMSQSRSQVGDGLVIISPQYLASLNPSASSMVSSSSSSSTSVISTNRQQAANANWAPFWDSISSSFLPNLLLLQHQSQPFKSIAPLSANSSAPTISPVTDRTKLFVGNLADDVSLDELIAIFEPFGAVNRKLSVVKKDNYAFIHFHTNKAAEHAIQSINGMLFHGRYIRVEHSVSDGHLKKQKLAVNPGASFYQHKNSMSLFQLNEQLAFPSSVSSSSMSGLRPIRGQKMTTSQTVNFSNL